MFRKLFGKKKKGIQSGRPKLTQSLSVAILRVVGTQSIASMPRSAQKAFQVSTDPEAEAKDFVEVIESDEALSAKVIKIANSVYYDRGSGSETIVDAVAVIGTNDLKDLLNASTLADVFASNHRYRDALWQHDIGVALAAKHLASRILPQKMNEAFVAGLMHDIGKLLLLSRVPNEYDRVFQQVASGKTFCEAEAELFPFDHCEVGVLIADKWSFSDELALAIRNHHLPWEDLPKASLPGIVKASNILVHAAGIGISSEIPELRDEARSQMKETSEWLGFSDQNGDQLVQEIGKLYSDENELYSI